MVVDLGGIGFAAACYKHVMKFVNEVLEGYFSGLEPKLQSYAGRFWDYQNGRGTMPQPKAYGIGDAEAQTVRIKLAQLA